ncbi:MAG: hypothetical protein QG650_321 [Patescibacteria group bacterium]|nr:hypothetical protein [Patescibacteria group bacterium]
MRNEASGYSNETPGNRLPGVSASEIDLLPFDFEEYGTWTANFEDRLIRLGWPTVRFVRILASRMEAETTDAGKKFPETFFQEFLDSYEAYKVSTGEALARKRDFARFLSQTVASMPEILLSELVSESSLEAARISANAAVRENPRNSSLRRKRDSYDVLAFRRNGFLEEAAKRNPENVYVRFEEAAIRLGDDISATIRIKSKGKPVRSSDIATKRISSSVSAIIAKNLFERN